MTKLKLGDILEIKTLKGNAYLHYVYNDKTLGDLIRVLPGLYQERPNNLERIAQKAERYSIFFPLSAAYKKKIVYPVGYFPMPDFKKPKHMRAKHIVQGEVLGWHIVDSDTWQRKFVKSLSNEEKHLSPWGSWNDTLLIERLEDGWSLESWI